MYISEGALLVIVGFVPALISLLVSFLASLFNAWTRAKEKRADWTYEEKKDYEKSFAEMITAVKFFTFSKDKSEYRNAIEKINLVRIKSIGPIASLLDNLYAELAYAGVMNVDWERVEQRLAALVDARRREIS